MAWTASGMMGLFLIDHFDPSALSVDLSAETHKGAFWTASVTPNFSTDTAYGSAPWNAGESSGAGYSAGGVLLATTTLTIDSGAIKWDFDNTQVDNSTILAEGILLYADATSDRAIAAVWFGSELETQDGTFLITWHSTGVARWDFTP